MLPDWVSNPGPLTYESGALPIALRGPACESVVRSLSTLRNAVFVRNFRVNMVAAIDWRSHTTHDWIWFDSFWGFNGPLRHVSLYRAVSERGRKKGEKIYELKNVQTTPTRTYYKRNRPLLYYYPN